DKMRKDEKAIPDYKDAEEILEEVKDIGTLAGNFSRRGRFHYDRGQYDDAWKYYKHALQLYEQLGDCWEEATTLNNMGLLYFAKDQVEIAFSFFTYTLKIFTDLEEPNHLTIHKNIEKIRQEKGEKMLNKLISEI